MLKLPICPYCHTVYSYKEVKLITKKEKEICYNCNKNFCISRKKGKYILLVIVSAVLILADTFIIFTSENFNNISLYSMLIVNMLVVLLTVLFFPFTVKFKKMPKHQKR